MPLTAIAFGAKLAGSIIGGRSKKKAANRRYRQKVQRIRRRSDQMQTDLTLQTEAMMSGMQASMGATGARVGSGTFGALRQDEGFKYNQRRERILQGETDAITDAATERRATRDSANLEMGLGIADAFAGGGADEFLGGVQKGFNYAAEGLGTARRWLTGQKQWGDYSSFNQGMQRSGLNGWQQ